MLASQPTSPTTSSRKRRSLRLSSFDVPHNGAPPSPHTSGTTSGTTTSRRSSRTSQTSYQPQSPVTPRPKSSRSSRHSFHQRTSSRASVNSIGGLSLQGGQSRLGNLADELDQAWDEDAELEHQGSSFLDGLREGDAAVSQAEVQSPYAVTETNDFCFVNTSVHSPLPQEDPQTLHVPHKSPPKHHQGTDNHNNSVHNSFDYGSDHHEEDLPSLPLSLRQRMREIERLSRDAHNRDSLSDGGGVVTRTIAALHDLGPQSDIEYGVTKVSTAYLSMATHRNHKQREMFALSHSLLYGNAGIELPEEFLESLIDEIDELSSTLPFVQGQNPLLSLQILASQTSDLTHTLRGLTDLLQESKVAVTAASRKLKSVREMVEDMSVEEELVEASILLIQAGDWDRRCRERQAGRMCREVVSGFGEQWGVETPKIGLGKVGA